MSFIENRRFNEDKGSYVEEYRLWRTKPIVPTLFGIFEVSADEYANKSAQEILSNRGHSDVMVVDLGGEEYFRPNANAPVGGYTCGVQLPGGKKNSAIFMRENVLRPDIRDRRLAAEVDAMGKLGNLMHEIGHADDIDKRVNFDDQLQVRNDVQAEFYAHDFWLKYSLSIGYRRIIHNFCLSMERDVNCENDVYREAAKLICAKHDIAAIKKAADIH